MSSTDSMTKLIPAPRSVPINPQAINPAMRSRPERRGERGVAVGGQEEAELGVGGGRAAGATAVMLVERGRWVVVSFLPESRRRHGTPQWNSSVEGWKPIAARSPPSSSTRTSPRNSSRDACSSMFPSSRRRSRSGPACICPRSGRREEASTGSRSHGGQEEAELGVGYGCPQFR
jgi:hypothetical protein